MIIYALELGIDSFFIIFSKLVQRIFFSFQKSTVTAMDGSSSMVGSIDLKCEISPIISSAYGAARDICEYHYMTAPELDYR